MSNRPTGHYPKPPPGLTPEARARQDRLHARAIEVIGDLDVSWLHRGNPEYGKDDSGEANTPHRLAAESQEGLDRLLAILDEMSKLIVPRWDPAPKGRRKSRR